MASVRQGGHCMLRMELTGDEERRGLPIRRQGVALALGEHAAVSLHGPPVRQQGIAIAAAI